MSKISLVVLLFAVLSLAYSNLHADVKQCKPGSPAIFKFMGKNAINLREDEIQTFETFSFKSNMAILKWKSSTEVEITVVSKDKRDLLCTDEIMITSFMDSKLRSKFFCGKHTTTIKLSKPSDQAYVKYLGI